MKIYQNTEFPRRNGDESYSVDVITKDSSGVMNVAYYDFEDSKWRFYADIQFDIHGIDFTWMYDPFEEEIETTKQTAMTSKEKVKLKFPYARSEKHVQGIIKGLQKPYWIIRSKSIRLGTGDTESKAWKKASENILND